MFSSVGKSSDDSARLKYGYDHRITMPQYSIAAGISGIFSRTLTSFVDVVKISSQLGAPFSKNGFIKTSESVYKREGIWGLFKGNFVGCLRLFPYCAIQFTTYMQFKKIMNPDSNNYYQLDFIAGASAGLLATIITYPLDVIKTAISVTPLDRSISHYKGVSNSISLIYKHEGLLGFYKGLLPSIIGIIPFTGTIFMVYELVKATYARPPWELKSGEIFLAGCIAAAVAQAFSYPLDVIRKKMQFQSSFLPLSMRWEPMNRGMMDIIRKIVLKNGILGLWYGTTINLIKVIPFIGLLFMSFESFKKFFLWKNGYTESPFINKPLPNVNQLLSPDELRQWYKIKGLELPSTFGK